MTAFVTANTTWSCSDRPGRRTTVNGSTNVLVTLVHLIQQAQAFKLSFLPFLLFKQWERDIGTYLSNRHAEPTLMSEFCARSKSPNTKDSREMAVSRAVLVVAPIVKRTRQRYVSDAASAFRTSPVRTLVCSPVDAPAPRRIRRGNLVLVREGRRVCHDRCRGRHGCRRNGCGSARSCSAHRGAH